VVRPLPRVNSRPHCRHPSSFRILVIGHNPVDSYAGTSLPNDRCRKSQSAVELSVGRRAAIPSEPSKQRGDLSHTRRPRDTGNLRHAKLTTPQQRKEGDLIIGRKNLSAIGTLVERVTGFVLLLHLPDDHTASTVADAMSATIGRLPEQLRRSLTWDQGSEMALHTKITEETGLPIYFCDPHAPLQRGTNENTVNGAGVPPASTQAKWNQGKVM
jgi:IS30 family transposase